MPYAPCPLLYALRPLLRALCALPCLLLFNNPKSKIRNLRIPTSNTVFIVSVKSDQGKSEGI